MAEKEWLLMFGGLIALLAFLALRKPEPTARISPPLEETQRRIWEQIVSPPTPTPIPTRDTNACGSPGFGYPNFAGTPRAGEGCVDSLDCQNHPPVGHPEYQECCIQDGTCFTR